MKAYKNPEFLYSQDARELRILAEFIEPRARMKRAGIQRAIAIFGSARLRPGNSPDYCAAAAELGRRLAEWTSNKHLSGQRYHICTGGGSGVMEAVGRGVASVDRRLNVGLNISLPREQQPNPYLDPDLIFEFHYFFMRKFWFANLAQGVVVFPGGFGTIDELFEVLTLIQTRKVPPRPVVLFGSAYWSRVIDMQLLVDRGFIDIKDRELFVCVDDVLQAYECLIERLPNQHDSILMTSSGSSAL